MPLQPVVLQGRSVRLEPLELHHATGVLAAGSDPAIWTHLSNEAPADLDAARRYIQTALDAQAHGSQLPFAILLPDGELVGSTRYGDIRLADRGLEIGWTWLTPRVQRTAVNSECKLLLLSHAFETLGMIRVQLKTDIRNERSQRAIERLGAVREGVLRSHMLRRDGSIRDTVLYSITHDEWPAVRARLCGWLR